MHFSTWSVMVSWDYSIHRGISLYTILYYTMLYYRFFLKTINRLKF